MRQDMKNIDDLKEVLTSIKMSFILFWNISQKRNDKFRAERPSLQDVLWVHGFAFMCNVLH